jgi:4a-hydroxytetrahydrobiopterin dehydratase
LNALAERKCVPCDGKTQPLGGKDAQGYLRSLPGWKLTDNEIVKEYRFRTYLDGLEYAYALGKIAEEEDHHPDILVKWKRVRVTLTTHAIKGLSDNDFIIAAKAERLFSSASSARKSARE